MSGLKNEVVVSGLSVKFPESDDVNEFRDNLYNKVDMVTEDGRRWPVGKFGIEQLQMVIQ